MASREYGIAFMSVFFLNLLLWWYFVPISFEYQPPKPDIVKPKNSITQNKEDHFNVMIDEYFQYHDRVMKEKDQNAKFAICTTNGGWGRVNPNCFLTIQKGTDFNTWCLVYFTA